MTTAARHTCNTNRTGIALPVPLGSCARCNEGHGGWVAAVRRDSTRRAHFAPGGGHGECGQTSCSA